MCIRDRTPVAWLAVTEAQHVIAASCRKHGPEGVDELAALVVLEDVEEAAVEHRVELIVEGAELEGVPNQEPVSYTHLSGCRVYPMTTVDDFVKRSSVRTCNRLQGAVSRIAQRDHGDGDPVLRMAEHGPHEFLVANGGMARTLSLIHI